MEGHYDKFPSLVPLVVTRKVASNAGKTKKSVIPMVSEMETVALFCDISGFTAMCRLLDSDRKFELREAAGFEQAYNNLNEILQEVVRIIINCGGDILKFAGDAIISIWPTGEKEDSDQQKHNLETRLRRCLKCCTRIQETMQNRSRLRSAHEISNLSVKCGVGFGKVFVLHLGGVLSRLEFLAVGPAFDAAFNCEKDARGGQIIVTSDIVGKLEKLVKLRQIEFRPIEGSEKGNYQLVRLDYKAKLKPAERKKVASQDVAMSLLQYIPGAIIPYISIPPRWTAELRKTSNLFISINVAPFWPELKGGGNEGKETWMHKMNKILQTVQRAVYKYEGSLNKFLFDDKGLTILAIFGLPPLCHIDDPQRAVMSAISIFEDVRKIHQVEVQIGVSTGWIYTGLIGSADSRWEYGVIGNKVNMAARLLGLAKKIEWKPKEPCILCGENVMESSRAETRLVFTEKGGYELKGMGKVCVWSVHERTWKSSFDPLSPHLYDKRTHVTPKTLKELEDKIISTLTGSLEGDEKDGDNVLLLEGVKSMGKSQILRRVIWKNRTRFNFCWGVGDAFFSKEKKWPCDVWRQVIGQLMRLFQDQEMMFKQKFTDALKTLDSGVVPLKHLFNDMVPDKHWLKFRLGGESRKKRQCLQSSSSARMDTERQVLMLALLAICCEAKPVVICLDECQHMCLEDWLFTKAIINALIERRVKNVGMIIVSQPVHLTNYGPNFPSPGQKETYAEIRHIVNIRKIMTPSAWKQSTTKKYLCRCLKFMGGVNDMSEIFVKLIHERCGGRPGFTKLMADVLKSKEGTSLWQIVKVGDKTQATFRHDMISSIRLKQEVDLPIPKAVWGFSASQLDKLVSQPESLLCLKTAAVIATADDGGDRRFSKERLLKAFPLPALLHNLDEILEHLVSLGFLVALKVSKQKQADLRRRSSTIHFTGRSRASTTPGDSRFMSEDVLSFLSKDDATVEKLRKFTTKRILKDKMESEIVREIIDSPQFELTGRDRNLARKLVSHFSRDISGRDLESSHYAFAFGFLRDIIFQRMLHSQRETIKSRDGKALTSKTDLKKKKPSLRGKVSSQDTAEVEKQIEQVRKKILELELSEEDEVRIKLWRDEGRELEESMRIAYRDRDINKIYQINSKYKSLKRDLAMIEKRAKRLEKARSEEEQLQDTLEGLKKRKTSHTLSESKRKLRRKTFADVPHWLVERRKKISSDSHRNTLQVKQKKHKKDRGRIRSNSLCNPKKKSVSPSIKSNSYIDSQIDPNLLPSTSRLPNRSPTDFIARLSSETSVFPEDEEILEFTPGSVPRSSKSATPPAPETIIIKERKESDSPPSSTEEAKTPRLSDDSPLQLSRAYSDCSSGALFKTSSRSLDEPEKRSSLILPSSYQVKTRTSEIEPFPSTGDNAKDRALIKEMLTATPTDLETILRSFGVKPQKKKLIKTWSTPAVIPSETVGSRIGGIINESWFPPEPKGLNALIKSKSLISCNFSSLEFIDEKSELEPKLKAVESDSDSWDEAKADTSSKREENRQITRSETAPSSFLNNVLEGSESPSSSTFEEAKRFDGMSSSVDVLKLGPTLNENSRISEKDNLDAKKDLEDSNNVETIGTRKPGFIGAREHSFKQNIKHNGKEDYGTKNSSIANADQYPKIPNVVVNSPDERLSKNELADIDQISPLKHRTTSSPKSFKEGSASVISCRTHRSSKIASVGVMSSSTSGITHRSSNLFDESSFGSSNIVRDPNSSQSSPHLVASPGQIEISSSMPHSNSHENHTQSYQEKLIIRRKLDTPTKLSTDYEISSNETLNIDPCSNLHELGKTTSANESLSENASDIQEDFMRMGPSEVQNLGEHNLGINSLNDSNRELRQIRIDTIYPFAWETSAGRCPNAIYLSEFKSSSLDSVPEFPNTRRSHSLPGEQRIADRAVKHRAFSVSPSPKMRTHMQPQNTVSATTPPAIVKVRVREDSPSSAKDATSDSTSTARLQHSNARGDLSQIPNIASPPYIHDTMFPYVYSPGQFPKNPHEKFRSKSLGNQASMRVVVHQDQSTNVEYIF